MLERLKNVAIPALFGALLFSFGIALWSASFCEPIKEEQASGAKHGTAKIECKPFNISAIQSIGISLARADPSAMATAVTAFATFVILDASKLPTRESSNALT